MLLDATHSGSVCVEVVRTTGELRALRDEWVALWSADEGATPFQSPEWLIPWWEVFGDGELCVLTLREDDRLVALVPLYFDSAEAGGTLRLIGGGVSDYLDLISERSCKDRALAVVVDWLVERQVPWRRCIFDGLRACSPWAVTQFPKNWSETTAAGPPCPSVTLPRGERGSNVRFSAHLAQDRRRLSHSFGELRVTTGNDENVSELFAILVELHCARWTDVGQGGVLADSRVREFHERAARGLMRTGVLRSYVLSAGSRTVAGYHGFLHRKRAYYYLSGFDPAARRFGVGNLVVAHALAEAEREGAREFDFLRGAEPYKYRWGAADRPTFCRTLQHAEF